MAQWVFCTPAKITAMLAIIAYSGSSSGNYDPDATGVAAGRIWVISLLVNTF
jgi:hypothetical protein